jgi:hypothetical protein
VNRNVACYLGLPQYNLTAKNKIFIDFVFVTFSYVNVCISSLDLVEPDTLHSSLVVNFSICLPPYTHSARLFRNYACGECVLLYSFYLVMIGLVHSESSAGSVINYLNSVFTEL